MVLAIGAQSWAELFYHDKNPGSLCWKKIRLRPLFWPTLWLPCFFHLRLFPLLLRWRNASHEDWSVLLSSVSYLSLICQGFCCSFILPFLINTVKSLFMDSWILSSFMFSGKNKQTKIVPWTHTQEPTMSPTATTSSAAFHDQIFQLYVGCKNLCFLTLQFSLSACYDGTAGSGIPHRACELHGAEPTGLFSFPGLWQSHTQRATSWDGLFHEFLRHQPVTLSSLPLCLPLLSMLTFSALQLSTHFLYSGQNFCRWVCLFLKKKKKSFFTY